MLIIISIIAFVILFGAALFFFHKKSTLNDLKTEIDKAEASRLSLKHQVEARIKERDQLKSSITELNQQLSETTERYHKLEILTISHLVKLNSLQKTQEEIFRNIKNSRFQVDSLKGQHDILTDQIRSQNLSLIRLTRENRDLKVQIENGQKERKTLLADKKLLEYDTEVLRKLKSDLAKENSNLLFEIATKRNYLDQNHQK